MKCPAAPAGLVRVSAAKPVRTGGFASAPGRGRLARSARALANWMLASVGGGGRRRAGERNMCTSIAAPAPDGRAGAHPNELDLRRITRALAGRRRYRYVQPRVIGIADGYRIESPCCSRNVDPEGGVIDIARLQRPLHSPRWLLQYRDHRQRCWVVHGSFASLGAALEVLGEDPERLFWP
jgi:hypothetical protein